MSEDKTIEQAAACPEESKKELSSFDTLLSINVNDHVERKNNLTYLSWSYAWAELCKRYPDSQYEVLKFENNLPYLYDPGVGFMVCTRVTVNGLTHEMMLPVMNYANKAMTKERVGNVQPATMFDINKTIMRCLTKNIAMHGLGLYIYAGEDIPEKVSESNTPSSSTNSTQNNGYTHHKPNRYDASKNGSVDYRANKPISKDTIDTVKGLKRDGLEGISVINKYIPKYNSLKATNFGSITDIKDEKILLEILDMISNTPPDGI